MYPIPKPVTPVETLLDELRKDPCDANVQAVIERLDMIERLQRPAGRASAEATASVFEEARRVVLQWATGIQLSSQPQRKEM